MDAAVVAYEAVPKALLYAVTLVAVGAAATRWLLLLLNESQPEPRDAFQPSAQLRRVALTASALAIAILLVRVIAHTIAAFGPAEAMRWESVRIIGAESRWGEAWRLQVLAAIALFGAAAFIAPLGRAGWPIYTAAALLFTSTIPLLGHAAGSSVRMLLHAGHLASAGAWLGSLAAIVLLDRQLRAEPSSDLAPFTSTILHRFSPLALSGAAVLVATGLIAGVLYVAAPANLVRSSYGLTLMLKVAGFAGVAACGRANWQRAKSGRAMRRPLLFAELALGAFVIAVTSVLTELEHP